MPPEKNVAVLLDEWRSGDLDARDALFDQLYHELRLLSAAMLSREGAVSLSPGDLVNEAVIRLMSLESINWNDKPHFMALASRMMRRVLIDHARQKKSNKRKHQKVTLITELQGRNDQAVDLLALEEALVKLKNINDSHASIVEMRYFGGLTVDEVASVMDASPATVKRGWRAARAWLRVELASS
ncbi:MAG: ECF-type sigma factor [Pseudomonadota bacterium]